MKKNSKTSGMNTASAVDVAAAQLEPPVDGAASVMPHFHRSPEQLGHRRWDSRLLV